MANFEFDFSRTTMIEIFQIVVTQPKDRYNLSVLG